MNYGTERKAQQGRLDLPGGSAFGGFEGVERFFGAEVNAVAVDYGCGVNLFVEIVF